MGYEVESRPFLYPTTKLGLYQGNLHRTYILYYCLALWLSYIMENGLDWMDWMDWTCGNFQYPYFLLIIWRIACAHDEDIPYMVGLEILGEP